MMIFSLFLTSGCMNTIGIEVEKQRDKETKIIENVENIKTNDTKDEEMNSSLGTRGGWFSPYSFEILKELEGKEFKLQHKRVSEEEVKNFLRDSSNFSHWELSTNDSKVFHYQFEDIDYYRNKGEREILYFDFKQDFSEDIFYSGFSGGGVSILIDYENNTMTILKNRIDTKVIISAVKFSKEYQMRDMMFLGGYKENSKYKVVFVDKNNILYIVSGDPIELVKTKKLDEWKVISVYARENFSGESQECYTYLLNEEKSKLRKLDLLRDEEIYTKDIDKRIKGTIKKIEPEGIGLGIIFVLSKLDDNYVLYKSREDDFGFVDMKDRDSDGEVFENIDDIRFYTQNPKSMHLIILDKKSEIPIRKIEAFGLDWIELE